MRTDVIAAIVGPFVEISESCEVEVCVTSLECGARCLQFAPGAVRVALFEESSSEQRACAGAVRWRARLAPEIRRSPKKFDSASVVCVREEYRALRAVSGCADRRTGEDGGELHEFGCCGPRPPRSDMMFVVTEYGMVNLKGKSIPAVVDLAR